MKKTEKNLFSLLKTKRFAPLFVTQFLGAFNDNVFKNALVLIIAYQAVRNGSPDVLINAAAGLFILPFFLFSAIAGQLADKLEKSRLIRRVKLLEVLIMTGAASAVYFGSIYGLLGLLFLMGTQSAFFGPVKYSILPQQLKPDELVGGNALVEMGTFVAILLGTIGGGLLIQYSGALGIGMVLVAIAALGWLASRLIPEAPSPSPGLNLSLNPFSQTWRTLRSAASDRSVFMAMLAISWFWFLGAAYLTQFPAYAREILNGSENVVICLLACFSVGIGLGSLLCERLSGRKVEPGLVPLGIAGVSLFGMDLSIAYSARTGSEILTLAGFLSSGDGIRVIADLMMIGVSGGFFTVPLYAYIQMKTPAANRARIIAANNILNALFMVGAAVSGIILLGMCRLTVLEYFMVISGLNLLAGILVFHRMHRFFMRFLAWAVSRVMYRANVRGLSNLPDAGPAVIICNHVSFVDWLLISAACRRPVRFVMFEPIYRLPVLHLIFKAAGAIPIQSKKIRPKTYHRAFAEIRHALDKGDVVCLFPEGKLTADGRVDEFKGGLEKIVKDTPVPVIPMAIKGMWGSFFSRGNNRVLGCLPRRFRFPVRLNIGLPVLPDLFDLSALRHQVIQLKASGS